MPLSGSASCRHRQAASGHSFRTAGAIFLFACFGCGSRFFRSSEPDRDLREAWGCAWLRYPFPGSNRFESRDGMTGTELVSSGNGLALLCCCVRDGRLGGRGALRVGRPACSGWMNRCSSRLAIEPRCNCQEAGNCQRHAINRFIPKPLLPGFQQPFCCSDLLHGRVPADDETPAIGG